MSRSFRATISQVIVCRTGSSLPKVAIAAESNAPGIPRVLLDSAGWMRKAADLAAATGARRVGLLAPVTVHAGRRGLDSFRHDFGANIERLGLETRDYWQLGCSLYTPYVFADWLRVLLYLPEEDRPDTLLIADDNLVEPLTAALPGHDAPRIVAHCNFPALPSAAVPVHFVGFDLHALMNECLRILGRQRAGLATDQVNSIPAITNPPGRP